MLHTHYSAVCTVRDCGIMCMILDVAHCELNVSDVAFLNNYDKQQFTYEDKYCRISHQQR